MTDWPYDDEVDPPLGLVPVEGRGSLPFALVHGESLLAAASWALTTAGATLYDLAVPFAQVREQGLDLVVHDPLCPLTPVEFLLEAIALSRSTGAVVVGVRPVTDTVKQYDAPPDGPLRLGATVDRDGLVALASPVVLPAAVLAALDDLGTDDLAGLVAGLSRRFPVRHLEAPALARRVTDEADLEVLAALSATRGA
ncbi:2-C-methyl-D-erythritol 4-phosphate cytidylyltransferase [Nocardioides aurantiacus]|uniref:2-C-methyl-D-erythritol 4-phosphate cytidylyltransferase n=1 Tax=Nocardioides aurantiacus TaxID=86796 RepID=A0A3N2CYI8_9ACTN|nr:2-C-methyl-D-erythritol 4-phosphate cytidylyltransferase [Nocardioides aurantiacus]ROR92498.1 2-C-methyl-D-erythritol 4-phosphate cytidylyltransferase [Nocardioides aurantiacus]